MSRWLSWLAMLCLALQLGAAEPAGMVASKPEVRRAVVATIETQLAALRNNDLDTAYGLLGAQLRREKPFQLFIAIVESNYPEIWENQRADFGIVRDNGRMAGVLVHVTGMQGAASYRYSLVNERAGWRIHGIVRHEPARESKL